MDPQQDLLLPIPIIEEIIIFSALEDKVTFRATCKRFLQFTSKHFFPTFTTTLCGGVGGYEDGDFAHAKFNSPTFGVLDSSSNCLFVSDENNHIIRKIELSTNRVTTLCGIPTKRGLKDGIGSEAQFHYPSGLALHERENILYISDSWNHVIRSINLIDGKVNTIVGNARKSGREDEVEDPTTFYYPQGLVLDSISNTLYVADSRNHCIQRILLNENKVETLCGKRYSGCMNGGFKEATFCYPWDIVLNMETQELYVSDCNNHIIRVISLQNKTVNTLCGTPQISGYEDGNAAQVKFSYPRGLGFDSHAQCLYVADNGYAVRKISLLQGIKVTTLCGKKERSGSKGGLFPTFLLPKGIIVDSHSPNLYILEEENNRVRKISNKKW